MNKLETTHNVKKDESNKREGNKRRIHLLDKKRQIIAIKQEIDNTCDRLGFPIDEPIKNTVVFLNALKITTNQSCGGHIDRGLPHPYIDIEPKNKPQRFINEHEIIEAIAQKYNTSIDLIEVEGGTFSGKENIYNIAYKEAFKKWQESGETQEYIDWKLEEKNMFEKVKKLLMEFYHNRTVDEDVKLKFEHGRIHNGEKRFVIPKQEFSTKEQKRRKKILLKTRKEMKDFTIFLKNKYYQK